MRRELDLLAKYPRSPRDPAARAREKTPEDVAIARQLGREFFDGKRRHGYGGYSHDIRRWRGVVDVMEEEYGAATVLDVGCAKGNLLAAFDLWFEGLSPIAGIDISRYAIENAIHKMKPHLIVGDARYLPWAS